MSGMERRTFLRIGGGLLAGAALSRNSLVKGMTDPSADLILRNGTIVTMNGKQPVVESMAVRQGRILAAGSVKDIEKYFSRETEVIDLEGRSVSPGLIDGHSHVVGFGQMQLKYVLLRPPGVHSFDTLNEELVKASKSRAKGEWIIGRGFDAFDEGRFPRRWEIDDAISDHPVLIIHWGGQFGVANSLAMKKAGLLSENAEDPYGGKYMRDRKTGIPDGVLVHYPAIYSVYQPVLRKEEQDECAEWGMQQLSSQGITCVHDNFCHPEYASSYVRMEQKGTLPCRVRVYPYIKNLKHCQLLIQKVRRYDGPLVRLQGIKLAVDGYAMMHDPPEGSSHINLPMHSQPVFNRIISEIHRAGYQADVHAVGDKGVDWVLDAYEKAAGSAAECMKRRHRIEHFPFLREDSIRRAADLGVPVCLQPNFIEVKADEFLKKFGSSGEAMVDSMLPVRSFSKAGVRLAFGADVPAFPSHSPMFSIRSAMDRRTSGGRQLNRDEAVSFLQALYYHTIDGAYAAFDEGDIGSLDKGKFADFVIWNRDLTAVETGTDAAGLKPLATYLAGKRVYDAKQ